VVSEQLIFMKKLLLLFLLTATAFGGVDDIHDVWNEFARASAKWITMINSKAPGTIGFGEYQAWAEVKSKWRKTEREFDKFYRAGQ
jgi:hypothetical protein